MRANRLPRWQAMALYASGLVLLISGLLWLGVHYSVGSGAGNLPHPLESWAMRVHGLAAFAGLFTFGALAGAHIPQGWRMSSAHSRRQRHWALQRTSGLALCASAAALALTGYALYYFAPETVRPPLGWVHAAAGIAMTAVVMLHKRPKSRHLHEGR